MKISRVRTWAARTAGLVALGLGLALVPVAPAQAAGWTNLSLQGGLSNHYEWARACKTAESGGYGPVWKYSFQIRKRDPYFQASIAADVLRDGAYWLQPSPAAYNNQWMFGVVSGFNVYGSQLHDDRVQFRASDAANPAVLIVGSQFLYAPSEIANC